MMPKESAAFFLIVVTPLLLYGASTATTDQVGPAVSDCREYRVPCGSGYGPVTLVSPYEEQQAERFWEALNAWKDGKDWIPLNTVLHELLVVPPNDSFVRTYTIAELRKAAWIVDFSPFKDVFRECDAKTDFSCSQVFVENTLVFGDREWKTRLLRRALKKRGPSGSFWSGSLVVDGFRFRTSPRDAIPWVLDLGLRELFPLARKASEDFPSLVGKDSPATLGIYDRLLGSDLGNAHPALVLADRLSNLDPEVVVGYVIDLDSPQWPISRFQKRLQVLLMWWPGSESPEERARPFFSSQLDPLMKQLGRAYREYWGNPPAEALRSLQCLESIGATLAYELQGRDCYSLIDIAEFAFATPEEAWEYMEAARQRVETPYEGE